QARIMISDVINPNRVRLIYDEVIKVNKEEKRVELANSEISYDYLVISLGFETNTFGIKGMEENAFFINDIDTCRYIYDHIEYKLAKYNNKHESDDKSLHILLDGAGLSG